MNLILVWKLRMTLNMALLWRIGSTVSQNKWLSPFSIFDKKYSSNMEHFRLQWFSFEESRDYRPLTLQSFPCRCDLASVQTFCRSFWSWSGALCGRAGCHSEWGFGKSDSFRVWHPLQWGLARTGSQGQPKIDPPIRVYQLNYPQGQTKIDHHIRVYHLNFTPKNKPK